MRNAYMTDELEAIYDQTVEFVTNEVLPHGEMPEPIVTWEDDAVTLEIVVQPMVIQNIIVSGGGESRELDYADIVGQGNPDRDDEVQDGLSIELLEHDDRETFDLRLSPEGAFVPDSVVALDYAGEVVLDASR